MISTFPLVGYRYLSFITNGYEERTFVTCAAYVKTLNARTPILIQVPWEWYEKEFRDEEVMKKWEYFIGLMGGQVKYLGTGPYQGTQLGEDPVKYVNRYLLRADYSIGKKHGNKDPKEFITENKWVKWEIPGELPNLFTYYQFCLIRYLYCRHLCRIASTFFELKKALPKIQALKLLQMAHYGWNNEEANEVARGISSNYNTTWTVFDNNVRKLVDKQLILDSIKSGDTSTLQTATARGQYVTEPAEVKKLILNKKYKEAYEQLTR